VVGVLFLLTLLLLWLAWGLIANYGVVYLTKRRPPSPPDTPDNYQLAHEPRHFLSRDGTRLYGWWIPAIGVAKGSIIICHSETGSMARNTHHALPLHQAGFNVLMFDFRAHGQSEGVARTFGMYEKDDLLGAIDDLSHRGIDRVGVLGFSMGGAAALIAAAISEQIAAVVVEDSFSRFKNTLARRMKARGVPYFIGWQLAAWTLVAVGLNTHGRIDQVDPALWAKHIRCPVLFIHAERSHLVSASEASSMVSALGPQAELWVVPGAAHQAAYQAAPAVYDAKLTAWFSRWLIN
jgi:uncharacterized protein